MTPDRMAALVARWVRFYTRALPTRIAERRIDEIDADLHDHIAHERASGISDRQIAREIASRMVRGLVADVAWRRRQAKVAAHRSSREEMTKTSTTLYRSAVRVGLGVASILSLPLVAMLFTDEVVWSLADFAVAGVLLTAIGVALELAVRKAGNLAAALGIAAVGVAAAVFGKADDAPGLVLLGILLIFSACVLGVRTAERRS
jgi:peptidoglycan/LPS O-acetylase OafA/YrhL